MALKPYSELSKIDVLPHCDMREAKDDEGRKIKVPYLNWAKCIELLHEHGAEDVYFTPLKDPGGSYLFSSRDVESKGGRKTGCYFVSVEIHIDDKVFTMDSPLMNGALVVYDDTLNQLRIANCHARAFVKGVAIRTGLGFKLWSTDKDTDSGTDDLSGHNIYAIKERIERLITTKLQSGMSMQQLLESIAVDKKFYKQIMDGFQNINALENRLLQL